MADAVEAASKSLKAANLKVIESFVTQIVQKQLDEGQFSHSNITLLELSKLKSPYTETVQHIPLTDRISRIDFGGEVVLFPMKRYFYACS